jgi:hypothetical protein
MTPFQNQANDDDLHELMAIAVLCGQRNVKAEVLPIYDAWALAYPRDALGAIGQGLAMIARGEMREGYRLINDAAEGAETRSDQARDVRQSIKENVAALAAQ